MSKSIVARILIALLGLPFAIKAVILLNNGQGKQAVPYWCVVVVLNIIIHAIPRPQKRKKQRGHDKM